MNKIRTKMNKIRFFPPHHIKYPCNSDKGHNMLVAMHQRNISISVFFKTKTKT